MTRPRPDLPMVLLSHRGPVSFGRDESGRTASRGAGGLVTARIGADAGPSRRRLGVRGCHRRGPRCGWRADHQVFGVTLEPEPRLLDQAEPASQERQLPPFGCAWSRSTARALACDVEDRAVLRDSCTAWRWDRVAAVIDQQLRARARSSSRKLADLVGEVVVQEARRERVAALVMDDARVRVAEARAQAAKQAVQAGPNRADPTYRGPTTEPKTSWPHGASRRTERLAGGWRW